jgi:flagellar assembly factor FliW
MHDAVHTSIEFPHGLPGFEEQRRFMLVEHPRLAPLVLLQSEDAGDLCFLTLPVSFIEKSYQLSLGETEREVVGEDSDLLCLAIVTAPDTAAATANLLAPVAINLQTGMAVQAVRADTWYSHQHPLTEAVCW